MKDFGFGFSGSRSKLAGDHLVWIRTNRLLSSAKSQFAD